MNRSTEKPEADPAGNDGLLAAATRRADGSASPGSDAWWGRLFGELRSVAESAPAERRKEGVVALASARADAVAERGTDEWWHAVFAAVRQLDGIDGSPGERAADAFEDPEPAVDLAWERVDAPLEPTHQLTWARVDDSPRATPEAIEERDEPDTVEATWPDVPAPVLPAPERPPVVLARPDPTLVGGDPFTDDEPTAAAAPAPEPPPAATTPSADASPAAAPPLRPPRQPRQPRPARSAKPARPARAARQARAAAKARAAAGSAAPASIVWAKARAALSLIVLIGFMAGALAAAIGVTALVLTMAVRGVTG